MRLQTFAKNGKGGIIPPLAGSAIWALRVCLSVASPLAVERWSHPTDCFLFASQRAEGVGFEPTVPLTARSISSRVPSTGLSHPSKTAGQD